MLRPLVKAKNTGISNLLEQPLLYPNLWLPLSPTSCLLSLDSCLISSTKYLIFSNICLISVTSCLISSTSCLISPLCFFIFHSKISQMYWSVKGWLGGVCPRNKFSSLFFGDNSKALCLDLILRGDLQTKAFVKLPPKCTSIISTDSMCKCFVKYFIWSPSWRDSQQKQETPQMPTTRHIDAEVSEILLQGGISEF